MPDTPAKALLSEVINYLNARHHEVAADTVDGRWVLTLDGVVATEGEIIARAFALGLAGHGTVQ